MQTYLNESHDNLLRNVRETDWHVQRLDDLHRL